MFDVEYLNRNDADLTRDYSGKADLNLDRIKGTTGAATIKDVDVYDPRCLGRQKSIEWEIEHESRIMLCLKQSEFDCWEFIDLRLKDEMFRNMEIVLSPWLSEHLGDKVEDIIKESTINDEIKSTIKIVHSSLEGEI